MAAIPPTYSWPDSFMTSVQFNKISTFLSFLSFRSGGFCQLTQTVQQDIPTDSDYPIFMQNEEVDRDGGHSDLSNISRYQVNTPGRYLLAGLVAFSANANGFRSSKLMVNGGSSNPVELAISQQAAPAAGIEPFISVGPRIASLTVGDYVELRARQNSTATVKTSIADGGSSLTIIYLGA